MTAFAPTLQAFFTDRLAAQKKASSHTIAAYRDTLRLLLVFTTERTGTPPERQRIEDIDAPLVGAFLDHLERQRGNSVRSRNARLAAIHSLFQYAALHHPEHAGLIARVLAIPPKRCRRVLVSFLDEHEIDALLAAPDTSRWIGRRDHALLLVAIQTGLRVSELTGLLARGRSPQPLLGAYYAARFLPWRHGSSRTCAHRAGVRGERDPAAAGRVGSRAPAHDAGRITRGHLARSVAAAHRAQVRGQGPFEGGRADRANVVDRAGAREAHMPGEGLR